MTHFGRFCHTCEHRMYRCLGQVCPITITNDKGGVNYYTIGDIKRKVQFRYRTAYLLAKNNKGLVRNYCCSAYLPIRCPAIIYHLLPYDNVSEKLLSYKELQQLMIDCIKNEYKKTSNLHFTEIIDVTKCLTRKEKYMFRMDFKYNCHATNFKKRCLFAMRWWDKYYTQAELISCNFTDKA